MRVVLISTYDLGRQPLGLASPAAWLREAGLDVVCQDLSRERLDTDVVRDAGLVACFLPMHTATRLAGPVIARVRDISPAAHLCAYGLYAPTNAAWLRSLGVQTILGGEFEHDLLQLARHLSTTRSAAGHERSTADWTPGDVTSGRPPRLQFRVPRRDGLPGLRRYASLLLPGGERRTVGYTEASRGCRHLCRHCPVVPVYAGQFRVIPVDVVLADVRQQVDAGAAHVTFGDADFLNGVGHATRVVEALAREFPGLTYDVTIKVEHLLRYAGLLPRLRQTGCLFVTSAVESFDDEVLRRLGKGHTRADVARVVALCREAGVTLVPTFVPFTPWTTMGGYRQLLEAIDALDLVAHVAPVQLGLRLLVPAESRLLELDEMRDVIGPFDREALVYPWRHRDPRVDALQQQVEECVAGVQGRSRRAVFDAVRQIADDGHGVSTADGAGAGRLEAAGQEPVRRRVEVPYLDEPWYC